MIMIMIRIRIAKRFHHLHQSLSSTVNKPSLLLPSSPNCYNYLTINDSRISSRNYSSSSALLSPGAKVKAKAIKEQFPLVEFCINTRLAYPNNDNDNNNDDDDDDDDDDNSPNSAAESSLDEFDDTQDMSAEIFKESVEIDAKRGSEKLAARCGLSLVDA